MKRPLFGVAIFYVAGVVLGWLAPAPLNVLFTAAFVLLAPAFLWPRGRPVLLAVLLVLAGWINFTRLTTVLSPHDLRVIAPLGETRMVRLRGMIHGALQRRIHYDKFGQPYHTTTAQLDVSGLAFQDQPMQPAFGRVVTVTADQLPETFFAGQTVEVDGDLGSPTPPVAEGLFDYPAYLENLGIYHQLHVDQESRWRIVASPAQPPLSDRFCAWARQALGRGLPEEDQTLRLEWALTLGWKEELTDTVAEPFVKAATYHIFAVDGLRIAIISGILIGLLRATGVPRPVCGAVALPAICFYAAMTGWPASAIRAIVMITVVFGGWILKRPGDLVNSLLAAALLILGWDPRALFEAGFQLSFLVVLCIILILPFFEALGKRLLKTDPLLPDDLRPRWQRVLRVPVEWGVGLFMTSVAAWLGSIPLVAYYFHIFTPVSGPANVLAVPLCGLVLISNLSSLLLMTWLPWVAVLFNYAGWFCMKCIQVTSAWSASWPAAYFYLPMPGLFTLGLYYALLLGLLTGWFFEAKWRPWKIGVAALLCLGWVAVWAHELPVTRLTVLPVGGGYAVHVKSPGAANEWMVDCGDERPVDAVVKPFLRAQGVNRMANFILTHGEEPYTGGAIDFARLFRPRNVYLSAVHSRSQSYNQFEDLAQARLNLQEPLKTGDQLGPWTVLHPGLRDRLPRGADNALVLRAEIDGVRVLLLSDLGRPGQRALCEGTNDLRADVVVSGMPDQGEPLGDTLLGLIQPRVIVMMDNERDSLRHVDRALKDRLGRRGVPVIYGSKARAVTIEFRPGEWELRGMDGTRFDGREMVERR